MEFRNQDADLGLPPSSSSSSPSSSLVYNPPPLRGSAFSKPILPPSSSLLSPRAGGSTATGGGSGNTRNGSAFGNSTTQPPAVDNSSNSSAKNPDLAPDAAGGTASLSNSKHTTATADASSVKYKECLRNHAAAIGGHVVDGCGEFMPNGAPPTPEALKCAACGCHRSFHRKEADDADSYHHGAAAASAHLPLLLPPPHPQAHHHHHHHPQQQKQFGFGFPSSPPTRAVPVSSGVMAAFGAGNTCGSGGTTTESSSEEKINAAGKPTMNAAAVPSQTVGMKRFRTKFTAEQKDKMLAFAERIGWRIQKQEEALVEQFCAEVGVRRQVLKIWMHNNKNASRKQQQQQQPLPPPEQDQMLVVQHHQEQQ